jgi:transcriptional regulator with XRE-family HTH domain
MHGRLMLVSSSPTPRPEPRPVPLDETPKARAARQLAELMKRRNVKNAHELERMQRERNISPVVSAVTIRRILKAEAATEPEKVTLRRLAEFLNETYESAFPEPSLEQAPSIVVNGQRIVLSSPDNSPISPSLVERIQRAVSDSPTRK